MDIEWYGILGFAEYRLLIYIVLKRKKKDLFMYQAEKARYPQRKTSGWPQMFPQQNPMPQYSGTMTKVQGKRRFDPIILYQPNHPSSMKTICGNAQMRIIAHTSFSREKRRTIKQLDYKIEAANSQRRVHSKRTRWSFRDGSQCSSIYKVLSKRKCNIWVFYIVKQSFEYLSKGLSGICE